MWVTDMSKPESLHPLGHEIALVDAHYVRPGVAAIYLLRRGEEIAVIETGTAHSVPHILTALEAWALDSSAVRYIIPTHVHLDHAGGAGTLMRHCPHAELVIHPRGARHMLDPSKLIAGTRAVYGEDLYQRLYGVVEAVPAARIIEAPDGFELQLGDRSLRFLDTPGHARHHFCIYDRQSQGVFTGDTFGISYPHLNTPQGPFLFPTTTPVQFEPEALHQSIDRLMTLQPQRAYLTHFGPIDITTELVQQLHRRIDGLVRIARRAQSTGANRTARLEADVGTYLLSEIQAMGSHMTAAALRHALANDVRLNAQGLEVWLQRLETHPD